MQNAQVSHRVRTDSGQSLSLKTENFLGLEVRQNGLGPEKWDAVVLESYR